MSEKREKMRRYYARMQYIAEFTKWEQEEPPMILFWSWRRWLKRRPVCKG